MDQENNSKQTWFYDRTLLSWRTFTLSIQLFFLHRRYYYILREIFCVYKWIGHILIFSLSDTLSQYLTALINIILWNNKHIFEMQLSIWNWKHLPTCKTNIDTMNQKNDYVISTLFKTKSSLSLCYKYLSYWERCCHSKVNKILWYLRD